MHFVLILITSFMALGFYSSYLLAEAKNIWVLGLVTTGLAVNYLIIWPNVIKLEPGSHDQV